MSLADVIIIDSDEKRRSTLALLIKAATRLDVAVFPVLSAAFPGFCNPKDRLLPETEALYLSLGRRRRSASLGTSGLGRRYAPLARSVR